MPLALFDLDGTLIDQASAASQWAAEFGSMHSLTTDQISGVAAKLAQRRSKEQAFREIADELGLDDDPLRIWADYRRRMPELVTCTDDVLDSLSALRAAGWTIGIVTNGEVDNQEGKVLRTGLAEAVDGWVISAEAGVRKPDPAIFALAARRLGVPLRGWMVGDGHESDVAGGAAAGLRTAWIAGGDADTPASIATITAVDVPAAVAHILVSADAVLD
ncbi:HAD superfamily hydrolase (TIGR01549 family) [Microbacterium sp. ZKA21]|uniref:HAD family hydrolase n=1 Tax=Microbacterium sp. ZKA21 TaxID=3381694 RepID=UPI003D218F02